MKDFPRLFQCKLENIKILTNLIFFLGLRCANNAAVANLLNEE